MSKQLISALDYFSKHKPKMISCDAESGHIVAVKTYSNDEFAFPSTTDVVLPMIKRASIVMKHTMKHTEVYFYVNENKNTVVAKRDNKIAIVKCHKEDEWDSEIGIGLALSKLFNLKRHKAMREFFRNKKRQLDYKKYAKWVLLDFCNYDYEWEKFCVGQSKAQLKYEIKFN